MSRCSEISTLHIELHEPFKSNIEVVCLLFYKACPAAGVI